MGYRFISKVENAVMDHVESEAKVVVNEKTGSITISGQILLNACTIQYQDQTVNISKDYDLSQVLQEFSRLFRTKDQITILKDLHTAGHLRCKFEVE